ncbi:MIEF1 upstream open reading frame protein [Bactrocera dorsalis]|uniref:MIEF1 upstream open reading frame protein n=1 Tax=Bactrocera dorsalis TaxID=27457 RepID=A0A6I9V357_BACDO|nr:MIEF1 upstream open reading frame protein [Bactrocera dorsalis]
MLQPSKQQILRLYKHLIRYGNQLQLTDKNYFLGRIRREFREGRGLSDPVQIEFNFKRGETLLRKGRIL